MLRELEAGIDALRLDGPEGPCDVPVKLRVHDSLFVPLAKWSMLLTGNYRCITAGAPRPIRSEEHTSELQSLMRISYAVFCLKKKNQYNNSTKKNNNCSAYNI